MIPADLRQIITDITTEENNHLTSSTVSRSPKTRQNTTLREAFSLTEYERFHKQLDALDKQRESIDQKIAALKKKMSEMETLARRDVSVVKKDAWSKTVEFHYKNKTWRITRHENAYNEPRFDIITPDGTRVKKYDLGLYPTKGWVNEFRLLIALSKGTWTPTSNN